MALTSAQRYRELQLAVRARALAEIALAWRIFRGDLRTWRLFEAAAIAIIRRRWRDSAGLAIARFREVAAAAGMAQVAASMPQELSGEMLVRSLGSTGLGGTWAALARGARLEAAREVGLHRVSLAAGRHVLDGGRAVIIEHVQALEEPAVRWRRIAGPQACPFCRMLASRGAVYRARTAPFPAHDGCACVAEPVISGAASA